MKVTRRKKVADAGRRKTVTGKVAAEPLAIKHRDYLSLFSKAAKKPVKRNKMVDLADSTEIRAVSECIRNLLDGNVPIEAKVLRQMKRHKNLLRSLAKKCYPVKKKKRILKQPPFCFRIRFFFFTG